MTNVVCVVCGCFHPPLWIIGVTQSVEKSRGSCLAVHCHDPSHHELVHQPSHRDDDEGGCACCSSLLSSGFAHDVSQVVLPDDTRCAALP